MKTLLLCNSHSFLLFWLLSLLLLEILFDFKIKHILPFQSGGVFQTRFTTVKRGNCLKELL